MAASLSYGENSGAAAESPRVSDSDLEDQENELMALESILDPEQIIYQLDPKPTGQIHIDVELPKDFKIYDSTTVPSTPVFEPPPNHPSFPPGQFVKSLDDASEARRITAFLAPKPVRTVVEHLPPLTFHFTFPTTYPSVDKPLFTLQSNWLDRESLSILCSRLDALWCENKGMGILYTWISFLREDTMKVLNLTTEYDVAERIRTPEPLSVKKRKKKPLKREDVKKAMENVSIVDKKSINRSEDENASTSQEAVKTSKDNKENESTDKYGTEEPEPKPGTSRKLSKDEIIIQSVTARLTALLEGEIKKTHVKKPQDKFSKNPEFPRDTKEADKAEKLSARSTETEGESSSSAPVLDQRAVFDNSIGHAKELGYRIKHLTEYNEAKDLKDFNRVAHTCGVCFTDKMGNDFVRLRKCGHNFCTECCAGCYKTHITEGNVEQVKCLAHKCSELPSTVQVRDLVGPELFERYDSLMLKRALATMDDVIFCPRADCGLPVIRDADENEKLAFCSNCQYGFCGVCKMGYHGVEPCRFKAEEKLRLFEKYNKATTHEKLAMQKTYGKKALDLLVQATLSEKYIEKESKPCPHCRVPIEKFEGCNKVTCTKCGSYFCWTCSKQLDKANPYFHFQDPQSPCFNQLFGENDTDEEDEEDWGLDSDEGTDSDDDYPDFEFDWRGTGLQRRDMLMLRHVLDFAQE